MTEPSRTPRSDAKPAEAIADRLTLLADGFKDGCDTQVAMLAARDELWRLLGIVERLNLSLAEAQSRAAPQVEDAIGTTPEDPMIGWLDAFDAWLKEWDHAAWEAMGGPGVTPDRVNSFRAAFSAGAHWRNSRLHSQCPREPDRG